MTTFVSHDLIVINSLPCCQWPSQKCMLLSRDSVNEFLNLVNEKLMERKAESVKHNALVQRLKASAWLDFYEDLIIAASCQSSNRGAKRALSFQLYALRFLLTTC